MNVRLAAASGTLALLTAACSASDGGPGGAKAEVIAKGDPVCEEISQAVGQLGDEPEKDRDAIFAGVEQLKAIPQPGEDDWMLQLFIVHLQNTALAMDDAHQAGISRDGPRGERALATAREQAKKAAEMAGSYGFQTCAERLGGA